MIFKLKIYNLLIYKYKKRDQRAQQGNRRCSTPTELS